MRKDGERTRARLLAAARTEFAEHGIAGGRVDRIAAAAGVNKQRIYGLFGSKEDLFRAVINDAFDERSEELGHPTGDLAEFVGRVYDYHQANPDLLRLYLWEALYYGSKGYADDEARADRYTAKATAVDETLGLGDPARSRALLLTLIGLGAWPHAVPQLTSLIGGTELDTDDLRGHVVSMARAMLPQTL